MVKQSLHMMLWLCVPYWLSAQGVDYPVDLQQLEHCEITNVKEINTEYLEFSPTFYNDGIIYVASKPRGKKFDKKIKESFFDLKYYNFKTESESKEFYEKGVNDLHHFGPCAFNEHNKEIFYSVNYSDKKGADGRYHMKLLTAKYQDNGWQTFDNFPFNSHEYSIFHPAVSADGNTLVFASNMPGGYGKMDLYSIQKDGNGGWTLPQNLGPEINTASNDWFPNFHQDQFLFYSSEKEGGYGGLDIYVCKYIEGTWKYPQHLNEPVNSKMDDIGFALSPDGSFGFFSSNRKGGKGKDDIYKFQFPQPLSFPKIHVEAKEEQLASSIEVDMEVETNVDIQEEVEVETEVDVQFLVLDENSKQPLVKAILSIMPLLPDDTAAAADYRKTYIVNDPQSGKLKLLATPSPDLLTRQQTILSKNNGIADIALKKQQLYLVELSAIGYDNQQTIIDATLLEHEPTVLLSLNKMLAKKPIAKTAPPPNLKPIAEPAPPPVTKATVIEIPEAVGELIVFENLLYEYNKASIKKGGAEELVALAEYMQKYPQLEVELSAHTDAIGSAPYNLQLSQRRAEYAKDFLVERGIAAYRITAKGYGEQVIRNHCVEGVVCTDDEHAYNRRTELKITKR